MPEVLPWVELLPEVWQWVELFPVCHSPIPVIDSLWCTKFQGEYATVDVNGFSKALEVRFLGSPTQKELHFYGFLQNAEVEVKVLDENGAVVKGGKVDNSGSYAEKSISFNITNLGWKNGSVEVWLRMFSSSGFPGEEGKLKNVVIFVLGNTSHCEWNELFPVALNWGEM